MVAEFLTELDRHQVTVVRNPPLPFGALLKQRVPEDLFRNWIVPLRPFGS